MPPPYSAKAVANYFLNRAWSEGRLIDPLKLQKLLYFAHGWYLGLYGQPLLDETIQAWKFGPVIPSVYHEFKDSGDGPIDGIARVKGVDEVPRIPLEEEDTRAFLDRIWKVYGGVTGLRLSDMTHKSGTPWDQAWEASKRNVVIPDPIIATYFRALSDDTTSQGVPERIKA